ncbi:GntR family transcriptional regulator [Streptococcus equinus]|uniref:Transcriptional regulator, GntR family n=1 Tax=Streptococcus equinus ATCC 9812 TaxID=525379 RepID=E8JQP5_STREI|nr:transcriptional regulator, GntR family [Streptococcus equinus ATCC 9812]SUN57792.1 GntR family transcriptional regulator [Streptococcus equinus]
MKKYEQIFKELEHDITSGIYQAGDYLPTENELTQTYHMSRDTIRKALSLLAEAGLIQKIHGSGSQVIKHKQIDFPVSQLTSYKSWSTLTISIPKPMSLPLINLSLMKN